MNYSDGGGRRPPSWAEEQGPTIIATVIILGMIILGILYFMGWQI